MKTQFLQQQNGTIAYDDVGSGQLVVCVPSMGDIRGEYRFLAPKLVEAGYRVISMDLRGLGESSVGWSDYSVAGVGSDIVALIRSLDAGSAVIIGTSMAAGAAVWAAAEAPELISGMVLIGPFVKGEGSTMTKILMSTLFSRPWGATMWMWYFSTLYPTRKPADFADYTAALKANLKSPGRLEALVKMILAPKTASEARLPLVKAPAIVIMGSKDPDFKKPEDDAKWLADTLHTTYTMIDGAGHYPHAEMPEITAPLILNFLKTLEDQPEAVYAAPR